MRNWRAQCHFTDVFALFLPVLSFFTFFAFCFPLCHSRTVLALLLMLLTAGVGGTPAKVRQRSLAPIVGPSEFVPLARPVCFHNQCCAAAEARLRFRQLL